MEAALLHPAGLPFLFNNGRFVSLGQFGHDARDITLFCLILQAFSMLRPGAYHVSKKRYFGTDEDYRQELTPV